MVRRRSPGPIKAGRLSAQRKEDGSYQIDPAELARVYPFSATPETVSRDGDAVHHETPEGVASDSSRDPELAIRVAALEAEFAGIKALVEQERKRADEIREERDRWAKQAERLALLPAPSSPAPDRPGLLQRLFVRRSSAA